ncbi:MAG TPA: hypothetical protein VKA34_11745 [Balneolales bacterium]|nr:hypothetical protein [Balneolales bacterium]
METEFPGDIPNRMLGTRVEVRMTYIISLWKNDPDLPAITIAQRVGIKNEKRLYQYLQTHIGYGSGTLRRMIENYDTIQSE